MSYPRSILKKNVCFFEQSKTSPDKNSIHSPSLPLLFAGQNAGRINERQRLEHIVFQL
jgi:hypothetical protein